MYDSQTKLIKLLARLSKPKFRVATEVCDESDWNAGTWATTCAVLGVPLPPDDRLGTAPPREMTDNALSKVRISFEVMEQHNSRV